jgi:alkanesulfonate monooxygenase SsuD/methylene tetrahydromethanopterin reductase-like flavin-dependent oxidoreductase (luciferase family)
MMSQVRAGVFFHPTGSGPIEEIYEETLELIRIAEEEGIYSAWVSQLHFQPFRGRLSSPFPFLVKAAERTKLIQLSSGVVTLPFENPIRLAEDAAVTNVLLKGRLAFGVGSGEPVAREFAPFGVAFEDRHQSSERKLPILLKALRGEPLPPDGVFLQPPAASLVEKIWWASGTQERAPWAAKEGINLLLNVDPSRRGVPISQTNADAAQVYRSLWREKRPPQVGVWRIVFPGDTEVEALEQYWKITEAEAQENLKRGLMKGATTIDDIRASHKSSELLVRGTTERIIAQLTEEHEKIGFSDFLFYFTFSGLKFDQRAELLRKLARQIAGPLGWLRKGTQAINPALELQTA